PIRRVALQCADRDGLRVLVIAHACAFAKNLRRTDARAHAAQRICGQYVGRGALQVAVADLADEAGNIDLRGTRLHAWRVVAVVTAARGRGGSRGIEQRRDVGEFARKLVGRQAVRRDVARLLDGHTRSFVKVRT